jgi:AdoMet-dependent heme synthase
MKTIHHPGTPCDRKIQSCYEEINLVDGKWGFSSPQKLEIGLTGQCNLNCIHCWNNSLREKMEELPFELVKREVADFIGSDIKFTGGEPLLYSHFIDLLKLGDNRFDIEVTSNGTLIDENVSPILKDYIAKLNISLHGSTREIHEEITEKEGSYIQSINAITIMQNSGLNPTIDYTVMKENINDVINMILLAKRLAVKSLRFNVLRNCGRGKTLEKISKEEIAELRKTIFDHSGIIELGRSELYPAGYSLGLSDSKFYGCGGMRNQAYISPNGNVYPCNLSTEVIGNIKQNLLRDIWNSEKASEFRKRFICDYDNCNLKERCAGKCKA